MKKSFTWVVIGNLTLVAAILLRGAFAPRGSQGIYFDNTFLPMFTLGVVNMGLAVASGLGSLVSAKCKLFIVPFLLSGMLLFLVGFSLCTASMKTNNQLPTADTAAQASIH